MVVAWRGGRRIIGEVSRGLFQRRRRETETTAPLNRGTSMISMLGGRREQSGETAKNTRATATTTNRARRRQRKGR